MLLLPKDVSHCFCSSLSEHHPVILLYVLGVLNKPEPAEGNKLTMEKDFEK